MSLHNICMPIIATQSSDMYQKIILNRDLAIWSFIFVFIWQQNLHLILLFIANSVMYVKSLFLGSVLLHQLIWDSLYCRGMLCYLHFRRCTRFTNIIAMHMYCTVLYSYFFIQYLLHWEIDRYGRFNNMCIILEGLKDLILSRKGFTKLTPEAGRVSSIFLFPFHVFWCPPYAMGLRYHKHFRGPLRLTNDSFQIHMQYSITFYCDICQMNNYIHVTGPNLYHFGMLGICYFV